MVESIERIKSWEKDIKWRKTEGEEGGEYRRKGWTRKKSQKKGEKKEGEEEEEWEKKREKNRGSGSRKYRKGLQTLC